MSVEVDPLSADFLADPYPTYARLRAQAPAHPLGDGRMRLISRYADVQRVLRDHEHFSSETGYGGGSPVAAGGGGMGVGGLMAGGVGGLRVLIATDPPDHTRLRRLLSKPFAPRQIWALEPRVREICDGLLDDLLAAGPGADLHQHLSYPLPVTVIAEMLGIPAERKADFKRWSDSVVGGLDPNAQRDLQAAGEMFQFFAGVIDQRRAAPGDDLVSLLVTQPLEGEEPLTVPEVVLFCILILIAGNETTTNLLGNLFRALFAHPDQLQRLREDPSLVPSAIEEALRYDSPVQGIWRGARHDVEIAGVAIPAGTILMPLMGSANRDEQRYERADEFLVDRNPTDHQAFGSGVHLCLGAALARLEARVATEMLLARTTTLEPAGEPTPTTNLILRGLVRQPVHAA